MSPYGYCPVKFLLMHEHGAFKFDPTAAARATRGVTVGAVAVCSGSIVDLCLGVCLVAGRKHGCKRLGMGLTDLECR